MSLLSWIIRILIFILTDHPTIHFSKKEGQSISKTHYSIVMVNDLIDHLNYSMAFSPFF